MHNNKIFFFDSFFKHKKLIRNFSFYFDRDFEGLHFYQKSILLLNKFRHLSKGHFFIEVQKLIKDFITFKEIGIRTISDNIYFLGYPYY